MTRPLLYVETPEGFVYAYKLAAEHIRIGRSGECEVGLAADAVSRLHAELLISDTAASIRDLGSTNGTQVNGIALEQQACTLTEHDTISICGYTLRLLPDSTNLSHVTAAVSGVEPARSNTPADPTTIVAAADIGSADAVDDDRTAFDDAPLEVMPVTVHTPGFCITLHARDSTQTTQLERRDYTFGRNTDNDIVLPDQKASAHHAQLQWSGSKFLLQDLSSTNGTYVNGLQVTTSQPLSDGDVLRMGTTRLHFTAPLARDGAARSRGRPVVLVPGFAASELWLRDTKVWPNIRRIFRQAEPQIVDTWSGELRVGGLLNEPAVIPGLLRSDSFSWLQHYLLDELGYQSSGDLLEFPYDWRQDNTTTADQLYQSIAAWRKARSSTERVTIVAHSMGGLAARCMFAKYADRAQDAVERLILLGTPHRGSPLALALCLDGARVLPARFGANKIRLLALTLPSFYQLLPRDPAAYFDDGSAFTPLDMPDWSPREAAGHLEAARRVAELLDGDGGTATATTSIFGYDQKTIESMTIKKNHDRYSVTNVTHSVSGDGMVTESSAVLPYGDIHPVNQHHGMLYSDPDVLRRLRYELLERP